MARQYDTIDEHLADRIACHARFAAERNAESLDGLPALDAQAPAAS